MGGLADPVEGAGRGGLAFGDKRRLFDEAVARYQDSPGAVVGRQLALGDTARESVAAMLRAAATEYTAADHPPGCLVVSEPLLGGERAKSRAAIRARLRAGVEAGDLPAGTDVDALAGLIGVVVGGMSARARDGGTREELLAIADAAMGAWPPAAAAV